jgi:1-acyl-sn-glycerol-3-phosphate acyltransferase
VGYLWRTVRTGLGFGIFGIGALVVALGIFPLVRWLPGDADRHAQWIVHLTFRSWIWFATGLGLLRVQWYNAERFRSALPCVVVANHPTLIDIVLLIALLPQADCVVKSAAWRNPFLRRVVAGAGYIRNDGGATLVETCAARVRQGRWLVLLPEGTRSPAHRLAPFHRGAAHVAVRSGAPLLPVVITCDPPTLMKGEKWYHVPDRTVQFTVQVGEPIWARQSMEVPVSEGLAARQLTAEIREVYERRLLHVGG